MLAHHWSGCSPTVHAQRCWARLASLVGVGAKAAAWRQAKAWPACKQSVCLVLLSKAWRHWKLGLQMLAAIGVAIAQQLWPGIASRVAAVWLSSTLLEVKSLRLCMLITTV